MGRQWTARPDLYVAWGPLREVSSYHSCLSLEELEELFVRLLRACLDHRVRRAALFVADTEARLAPSVFSTSRAPVPC